MKVLLINECDKFLYPEGIDNLDSFLEFVENSETMFIRMQKLCDENGLVDFFIDNEIRNVYINFNNVEMVEESTANVVSETDFYDLLKLLETNICSGCQNNGNPETDCDSITGKRDKLDLDCGSCWLKEEIESMED